MHPKSFGDWVSGTQELTDEEATDAIEAMLPAVAESAGMGELSLSIARNHVRRKEIE